MHYYTHMLNETLHVHMEGEFTFTDGGHFRNIMKDIMKNDAEEIHVFINKLEFLDATALSFFMAAHDLAKKLRKVIAFVQPKGQVKQQLYLAAQHNPLKIYA